MIDRRTNPASAALQVSACTASSWTRLRLRRDRHRAQSRRHIRRPARARCSCDTSRHEVGKSALSISRASWKKSFSHGRAAPLIDLQGFAGFFMFILRYLVPKLNLSIRTQCERSFVSTICAWVTWAKRGLGRGELFRGFFFRRNGLAPFPRFDDPQVGRLEDHPSIPSLEGDGHLALPLRPRRRAQHRCLRW